MLSPYEKIETGFLDSLKLESRSGPLEENKNEKYTKGENIENESMVITRSKKTLENDKDSLDFSALISIGLNTQRGGLTAQSYKISHDRWKKIGTFGGSREGFGYARLPKDRVLIFGGEEVGKVLDTSIIYDFQENSWSKVDFKLKKGIKNFGFYLHKSTFFPIYPRYIVHSRR